MRSWAEWLSPMALFVVCCAPLFALTVRGWPSSVLFVGSLLCALLLWQGKLPQRPLGAGEHVYARAMVIALAAPALAAALSATLRWDFYAGQFDAPSRFLLGVPIFLFMLRVGSNPARVLRWVLPLGLLFALGSLEIIGRSERWAGSRETTKAVDPLVFGYLSLAFGLMCLMSISPAQWRKGERWSVLLRLGGLCLGVYLSLRSGSRSGWLALPLVLGVWVQLHQGRRHRWGSASVLAAACATPVFAYLLLPVVHDRVHETWQEIVQYPWTGVAPYTSVGLRITYLRIASEMFAMHPIAGMGDTSRLPATSLPSFSYASPEAVSAAFRTAFHNQVVSNAVRMGIGGLLATLALLLVPLAVCVRQLRRVSGVARENAAIGFAYATCIVVSSMSTEVVDLKGLASLYAVMTAVLCGAALAQPSDSTRKQPAE
jgi:O-antigen ligase